MSPVRHQADISDSLCHKILRTCTFIMKNCERDRNAVISQMYFPWRHPMLLSGPKKVSHLCCNNRWSQSDCLNTASLQVYSLKWKTSSKNRHKQTRFNVFSNRPTCWGESQKRSAQSQLSEVSGVYIKLSSITSCAIHLTQGVPDGDT